MDDQLTLRLPGDLARRLDSRAREAGVKRSAVVREALIAFLGPDGAPGKPLAVRERLAPFIGAIRLDRPALERDALARQLREHNWRE
jgi:hypothetical protein